MSAPASLPPNETERLQALGRYRVLDTERERSFDDISQLAASICTTPLSAVTMVDASRQWFKASVGLAMREIPRDLAFCGHTLLSDHVLVVEDATKDLRFATHGLVTGTPYIRFYAGAPLCTRDGYNIGTLCVFDTVPRVLNDGQKEALATLSRLVMTELDLRELNEALAEALGEVKALRDILPTCSYCRNIRNERDEWRPLHQYIMDETTTRFSHGVCPTCVKIHFPDYNLFGGKP